MIIKNKRQRKERNWIQFCFLLLISMTISYYIYGNNSFIINVGFHFEFSGFFDLFSLRAYFFIIILVFNFGNIYQTLVLFYSLIIPNCLLLILSFVVTESEYNKYNAKLFYDYFVLLLLYFIFWQIIFIKKPFDSRGINYQGIYIYIIFLFCLLIIKAVIQDRGNIFLDKIISAFLLTYSCYFFIFYVMNVSMSDSYQLFLFINNINVDLLTFLIYILIISSLLLKDKDYQKITSLILYINSLIIPLYGIIYEYIFQFKSNRKNWSNFNFEEKNDNENKNGNMNSLIPEITITKSIKWNKTTVFIDIVRLFSLVSFQLAILYLFNNFYAEKENNDAFIFFIFAIMIFVIGKIILKWLKMINMTYFFLERNSFNSN